MINSIKRREMKRVKVFVCILFTIIKSLNFPSFTRVPMRLLVAVWTYCETLHITSAINHLTNGACAINSERRRLTEH